MKTHLNIFKNCGAAQLEVEQNFPISLVYSSPDSKFQQKKWFTYYKIWTGNIIVLKLKLPSNAGGKSTVVLSENQKNRYVGTKPLHCDT
jgi:hypothetical protein